MSEPGKETEHWLHPPSDAKSIRRVFEFDDGETVEPRVVRTDLGLEGCHYHGLQIDLQHVLWVCDQIENVGVSDERTLWSLIESGYLRYRRCFAGGRRYSLAQGDIEPLGKDALSQHYRVKEIADRYVAHSVSDRESFYPLAYWSELSKIVVAHEFFVIRSLSKGIEEIAELRAIATLVLNKIVIPKTNDLKGQFESYLTGLSADVVEGLPRMSHKVND